MSILVTTTILTIPIILFIISIIGMLFVIIFHDIQDITVPSYLIIFFLLMIFVTLNLTSAIRRNQNFNY